jgi:lipid-A-disaccharide synthase
MKTILLSAGDLSGEQHAAELVLAVRERIPEIRFIGMGGSAMAAAGVELSVDQRELAVGGYFEIFGSLPRIFRAWRGMKRCLRETRPDLVILVDSGGFNLPFARHVRRRSKSKILYYIAPQIWASRSGRLRKLVGRTDRIAVILPFEASFYSRHGAAVDFVGHPAIRDQDTRSAYADSAAARNALGISSSVPLLAIFPGSRRNELTRHLPVQLEAFMWLRQNDPSLRELRAVVGIAPSLDLKEAERIVAERVSAPEVQVDLVQESDGRVLDACDVALVKPGTITVELMLRRKPMVVIGRVHPLTAMLAKRIVKVDWLALPNLIADAEIVPELLQQEATRDRITSALAPLFRGEGRDRQIQALDRMSQRLGRSGAANRVAAIVEEMLGTASA